MHIREAAVDAVVVEAQRFVIEAQEVQRGGVEVVAVGGVLGGFESKLVGAAIGGAAPDPTTGHPRGKRAGIVIAAFAYALRGRLAAKLSGANDEGAIEQAPRLQIRQQRSGSGIENGPPIAVIAHEILMAIPVRSHFLRRGVFRPAIDLHESRAALDEPTREDALAPKGADVFVFEVVELFRGLRLAPQIGGLGSAELQTRG